MAPAAESAEPDFRILVLGDVNLDVLIAPLPRDGRHQGVDRMTWESDTIFYRYRRRGGTWLLHEMIRAAVTTDRFKDEAKAEVLTYDEEKCGVSSDHIESQIDLPYLNSATILGLFPRKPRGPGGEDRVYRIKEILGWVHNAKPEFSLQRKNQQDALRGSLRTIDREIRPRILVLHDRNGDFRRLEPGLIDESVLCHLKGNPHLEPDRPRLNNQSPGWIVWQMYSPLAEGNLWKAISGQKDWLDRTVVVVKADCLRQAGVNLAEGLSLERESQNFLTSIEQVDCLRELVRVRHLIVHFHRQGVLHYDREQGLHNSCYFCPYISESGQASQGTMVGYTSILVAAVVRGLTWSLAQKHAGPEGIMDGIKQGVILDHRHYLNGYAGAGFAETRMDPKPYDALFQEIDGADWYNPDSMDAEWRRYRLASLVLPAGPEILSKWSRIEGFIQQRRDLLRQRKERSGEATAVEDQGEAVACEVVCRGLKAVVDPEPYMQRPDEPSTPGTPPVTIRCPYEEHGKIKTADRNEIDSFSSILRIMEKYRHNRHWRHPLSIAVFGPPGSGKSFTIKQILGDIDPEIAKRPLEYNLAQFKGVQDLETAFHQVQDRSLASELPLVVFDEFDSNYGSERLGWLKYFLAPMQDGKFKAGESMYRIGRAIFVFTGGIAKTFSEFYDDQKMQDYFKAAKGSDFVSRLRGYLNIAGINAGKESGSLGRESEESQEIIDSVLMFRRAVLLRSLLEDRLEEIIDGNTKRARIDLGVVRAFLRVKRYEHGARSMQAIIEMTRISHRGYFLKSSLPSAAQLNMHVNAAEFLDLVYRRDPIGSEGLAESIGTQD